VPNPDGVLKPGSFATARIQQATDSPGILVPRDAVRTVTGTSRVFVVSGDRVAERLVTLGQPVGDTIELTSGIKAGETVAVGGVEQLSDGARVTIHK
jgi:multidrug efflux pump subunit AcrA (membrane-fusion protein)